MPEISDQRFLKEKQYKTPVNLEARINLHRRFGTKNNGWWPWLLAQLNLHPSMRLLEIGCGPGSFWGFHKDNLPGGLSATLGDLSLGMVQAARQATSSRPEFSFITADAQNIPAPEGSFDLVMANHMLYHVPDMDQAVREFRRVLRPGGRLAAATNGEGHMGELGNLLSDLLPGLPAVLDQQPGRFSLENGPGLIGRYFKHVEVRTYDEDLLVTEVEPLVDYIFSMWEVESLERQVVKDYVQTRFDAQGGKFFIHKSQGLLSAW